jgi:transposase
MVGKRCNARARMLAITLANIHGKASIGMILEKCAISRATLYRWLSDFYNAGRVPTKFTRRKKAWSSLLPEHVVMMMKELESMPMLYMHEVADIIRNRTGYTYTASQIHRAAKKVGLTRHVLEYRAREQ